MKLKKTFYIWQCSLCGHRNKEVFNFHYQMPYNYSALWDCSKCGSENYVGFRFRIYPITKNRSEEDYQRWY
jgi:hypothetical protein